MAAPKGGGSPIHTTYMRTLPIACGLHVPVRTHCGPTSSRMVPVGPVTKQIRALNLLQNQAVNLLQERALNILQTWAVKFLPKTNCEYLLKPGGE